MKKKKTWCKNTVKFLPFKMLLMMKAIFLIICLSAFGALASNTYAQQTKLTLKMDQSSIQDVLMEIEKRSEFFFLYNNNLVDVERKVDLDVRDKTISFILDKLFADQKVEYMVMNRQIILSPEDIPNPVGAFQNQISGTVTDEDGYPLPGVTVVVKGTTRGTVTNADGKYSLSGITDEEDAVLVFSFVGMKTREVAIAGQTTIDVVMEEETFGLDEVVVLGYGEEKRATLTGSASRITTERLVDMPNVSLAQKLEGQAAGVRVQQSSSITGATARIRVRGSLSEPLYVIDDVVVDKKDFDALMPEEVESINIMKDAATSSIYGSRAADGVVVVRTKKGSYNQKARFTYRGSANAQYFPKSIENLEYEWDDYLYGMEMLSSWGDPGLTEAEEAWLEDNPGFKGFGTAREYMWQTPQGQDHSISAEGGGENISYFVNLGIQDAVAGVPNSDYQKYNMRSSIQAKIAEFIELEWIADGFIEESSRPYWQYGDGSGQEEGVEGWFQHFAYPPDFVYGVVVDEEAGTGRIARPSDVGQDGYYWVYDRFFTLVDEESGYRNNTWRRFNNKLRLKWDLSDAITKGLSMSLLGNYTHNTHMYKHYNTYYSFYNPARENSDNRFNYTSDISKWQYVKDFATNRGTPNMQQNTSWANRYQANAFVNYDRSFGDHNLTSVVLYEYAGTYSWSQSGGRRDPMISGVDQFYNYSGNSEDTWFSGGESQYARASFAGRLNYNFKEKYILEFSFRNDASYLFPEDTRWGFFPSFSAAWRVDQEDFFNVGWINSLKPRFSYGSSGSEGGIAPFQFQHSYHKGGGWEFGSGVEPGLYSGVLPNPDITWAKTQAINAGLDFGLFNELIYGGIDYFHRENSDILGSRNQQFPSTWGASLPPVNYAANEISGAELYLNHQNQFGEFSYSVSANVSYAKDKVTLQDENPEVQGTWRSAIGRPASQVWGYRTEGIIKDQATLDALPEGFNQWGRFPEVGDLLMKDIRGTGYSEGPDGKIDGYDYDRLSENGAPRITYGFSLGGDWKGISLNTQFSGVGAYDKMYSQAWGAGSITRDAAVLRYRWHPEMNPDGWAPTLRQAYWGRVERGHGASDVWMYNSAYLRLKNVTLAYQIPTQWTKKVWMNAVRFYVSGTDLFTISKWPFGDPEIGGGTSYPRMRSFSGGVTVNF